MEEPKRTDAQGPLQTIVSKVFLDWEKLRIVYIIILALITLLLIGPAGFSKLRLFRLIIDGAIVANVAFCAGPILETYIRWLGYDRTWPRWIMFGSGTLVSIILAVWMLATELLPDQP